MSDFAEVQYRDKYTIALKEFLTDLCIELEKPLVVLFDEVDCLSNGTMLSFLRQIRDGYVNRSMIPFVHSVALVGMRNVRDYKVKVREDRDTLGSASPFNIVAESLTLRNFNKPEVIDLLSQHTKQNKQVFSSEVVDVVYYYSQGQPWLVNAMVKETINKILDSDYTKRISEEHVEKAAQNIILRRDTHIDSLLERLKEKRVQKVLEPVITGETSLFDPLDDDFQYVLDLGLLKDDNGRYRPSNPIYSEVFSRTLSLMTQKQLNADDFPPYAPVYLKAGKLDMKRLLQDFQQFWRENAEMWIERYQYKEAAPHLVLMAFLQRVLNGGGNISRELASGSGRLDLCVHYENHRYPIELKIRHRPQSYTIGKTQLARYMETLECGEGWLIVFDRRKSIPWKKKCFWRTARVDRRTIHTVGC